MDPRVRRVPIHRLGLQALLPDHRERRIRPANNPASASGATVAADAIASAFARDNFPARIASAVAGNSSTCFEVSNMVRAADTDEPDTAASCSAADRYPARCHVSRFHAAAPATSSPRAQALEHVEASNIAGVSKTNTASGSNASTTARIGDSNASTSLNCTPRRSSVTVTNTCSHMGETPNRERLARPADVEQTCEAGDRRR